MKLILLLTSALYAAPASDWEHCEKNKDVKDSLKDANDCLDDKDLVDCIDEVTAFIKARKECLNSDKNSGKAGKAAKGK